MSELDSRLLERAETCDSQALAEIYDCYAERIYYHLYRRVGDPALAEDLTSEVFIKLLLAMGTSRAPRDNLLGWLYRVATNLAADWFRQQARQKTVRLVNEVAAGGNSPPAVVEGEQSRRRLRQVLGELTPGQQQVILLRFGEGLKLAEVARLMGKSEGAVKLLQHRAIRRLGTLLEREEKPVDAKTKARAATTNPAAAGAGQKN